MVSCDQDDFIGQARQQGVGAGLHAFSSAFARHQHRWAQRGANLFVHSSDVNAALEKLRDDIRSLRDGLGDPVTPLDEQEYSV